MGADAGKAQVGDAPVRPTGLTLYELRAECGLEIMWLEFFTAEEVRQLASLLAEHGPPRTAGQGEMTPG